MFDLPPNRPNRDGGTPEPASLAAVSASWLPVVGRDGRPIGFRVALRPQTGAGIRPPAAELLAAVLQGFTAGGSASLPHGLVIIAPPDGAADPTLPGLVAPRNMLVEFGERAVHDAAERAALVEAQRHGLRLALRLDGGERVARERLPLFQYVVAPAPARAALPREAALLATGVDSRAQAEAVFREGANAVIGWPLHEPAARSHALQPTQKGVLELIRLVQADADVAVLERAFKSEPVLAYLLLTLANSPAFIRAQPIASLSQAISLLGYKRLVKWLVLLLVIASKASQAMAHIYVAVARGFLMENLAAAAGAKGGVRDDCFVIGVFSLLDKITGQTLQQLFSEVALPAPITDALLAGTGPYAHHLSLALALEADEAAAVALHAAELQLPLAEVNAALLQSLAATDALQSVV